MTKVYIMIHKLTYDAITHDDTSNHVRGWTN